MSGNPFNGVHCLRFALSFTSRIVGQDAKEILIRDGARSQKIMQGINPHGPLAFQESPARPYDYHRTSGDGSGTDTDGHSSGTDTPPVVSTPGAGVDATDAGITYTVTIGVGNPATQYNLLIDTGSSNTWVRGADQRYQPTSPSESTGQSVNVNYGSGSFSGTEYIDTVTLESSRRVVQVERQRIGVAVTVQGFQGVDGVIGVGPSNLTIGTVPGNEPVPTVTDNLLKGGNIRKHLLGAFFHSAAAKGSVTEGELIFSNVDRSRIVGDVQYVPITATRPSSLYWGIDQSLSYGQSNTTVLLSGSAGVVDPGTTLLLIATDAFQAYQGATGATLDSSTGLLTLSEKQFESLQSLFFTIGDTKFELTPNAQIWPREMNATIGGEQDKIYLVVADLGSPSGQGLDFISGFAFLKHFYSVYDMGNRQFGLAARSTD